jgi:uncharacterized protein (DUF362 family)
MNECTVGIGSMPESEFSLSDPYYLPSVQGLIHTALISGGLGMKSLQNPLADIIDPGMTVLLKPNWVFHFNKSGKGMECLVTHPNFIEAVVLEVIKCNPGKIIIGDAPLQGCNFQMLVKEEWMAKIRQLTNIPVEFADFRRTISSGQDLSTNVVENRLDYNHFVSFDLKNKSSLEEISQPPGKFRVTMYNPKLLAETHKPGRHQYLIARESFDADVILNLPKLKTHRKAGMTGALKNLVGVNGNKDYLPHHRIGGSETGGDCYDGRSTLKLMIEKIKDQANMNINKKMYRYLNSASRALKLVGKITGNDLQIEGGWHGNDTVWRMTLDLNAILLYGDSSGSMKDSPQRTVYSLTDAIIAGDTEGPLNVEPVRSGVVTFGSSTAFVDLVNACLMHFDYKKIHTIREAFRMEYYKLTQHQPEDCNPIANGQDLSMGELIGKTGKKFRPSAGWAGHIELAD